MMTTAVSSACVNSLPLTWSKRIFSSVSWRYCGYVVCGMGTGKGVSVLELVNTFEKVNGVKIPYTISDRRPGDIVTCFADASKAKKELGWEAEKTIEDMCKDSWNWQKNNPQGY